MPVSALQIDSHQIIEIVVEHGVSSWDPSMIVANAWAKLVGAKFSGTVITIQVPLKQNEPSDKRMRRIFEALMENGSFFENLRAFMDSLM